MKKIAFIITVYKKDNPVFFKESIDSIISQNYGFDNINIYLGVDGELTDELNEYILKNQSKFYKIVRNTENKGLAFTLNRLIEVLEDEVYVFRMDSDDVCTVNRVTEQVNFLASSEALIVGSNLIEIDENGSKIREKKMPISYKEIVKYSISRSPLNHPTVAFKKVFFDKVGVYNESFIKAQDYELWARALKKEIVIANINSPLLYFRITKDYLTKRNSVSNFFNEFKVSISLMNHYRKYIHLPKILTKLLIRLMPPVIGTYFYNKVRN